MPTMPRQNDYDPEQEPTPVVVMEKVDPEIRIKDISSIIAGIIVAGVVALIMTGCISSGPDFFQQQQSNRDFMTRIGAWENPYVSPAEKRYQVRDMLRGLKID